MEDINKKNLVARIFKAAIFASISLLMVVGNFFLEAEIRPQPLKQEQNVTYEGANIFIGDHKIVSFEANNLDVKKEMSLEKKENGYFGAVFGGRFWGNFVLFDEKVNLVAGNGKIVLIPDHAQFDASYSDGKLELAVYRGDVYVGFLSGVRFFDVLDAYDGAYVNRLLVSQGNKVTISVDKVTEEIRPLLYSKLAKEFKYTQISADQRDEPWVIKNLSFDSQDRENRKQKFVSSIILRGASANEGFLASILQWTQTNLTFVPEKHQKLQLRRLFAYMDDAIYYANSGDLEKTTQNLNDFDLYIGDVDFNSGKDHGFHYYFEEYVRGLNIFEPGEAYYAIEKFLLNRQFLAKDNLAGVVESFWQDVYEAIPKGELIAREALDNYYNYLDKYLEVLAMGTDEEYYKMYVAYQNQLFDNLLSKYPVFYEDGYFAIKNTLEKRYLELFQGHDREEMSQDLIDEKIDLLKRLRKFFLDGSIEIDVTKRIFSRLIAEIDALMPKDKNEVAVIALFESQLKDIADFWGYLSSPQYQTRAYGVTENERYKSYLNEKDKIWSFVNIREDVLGEKVQKSLTVAEVADEVKKQLHTFKDVSSVEVGEITDSEERYINVNLVIGGYPVKAVYDRVTTLLREVSVYDEEISKGSVKVEALLSVLQDKFADLSDDELKAKDESVTIETTAQRYARVYIAKILTDEGFIAEMDNVLLVDEDKAIYRVQEVILAGNEDMVVTFDLDMKGEVITNLFVLNSGEPQLIDGKFTVAELKAFIQADGKIDNGESLSGELLAPSGAVKVPR